MARHPASTTPKRLGSGGLQPELGGSRMCCGGRSSSTCSIGAVAPNLRPQPNESPISLGTGSTNSGEMGGTPWRRAWATNVLHEAPVPHRAKPVVASQLKVMFARFGHCPANLAPVLQQVRLEQGCSMCLLIATATQVCQGVAVHSRPWHQFGNVVMGPLWWQAQSARKKVEWLAQRGQRHRRWLSLGLVRGGIA